MQIGKCKLAHASLRNIIAWGSVLPSVPGQKVHGDPLRDDCVRVTVEKSILKNHCLPVPSTHLKTVEDAEKSIVAWPKEFVISCSSVSCFIIHVYYLLHPDHITVNMVFSLNYTSTGLLQGHPLSDPGEHDSDPNDEYDSDPNTKKTKKKKPSYMKSGELKSRRSSKRLKTAA